jgi:hypothetical protein
MSTISTNNTSKKHHKFCCEDCHFECSKKGDYNRHLLTRKHIESTNSNKDSVKNITAHICNNCNKIYKERSGLWRHKKKCSMNQGKNMSNVVVDNTTDNKSSSVEIDKEMVIKMLLKNQEVMEKMVEMMPNMGNNNITNSHNTTNNNQFNIQMFLNNHCKNAMNLTDFIDSLPITAETYDSNIDNGLTKTIANMFTAGLNQLDILERPIHCTDASRKTLYVKEGDVWEKDCELTKMIQGIRQMAAKQRILINTWRDAHDDWNVSDRMQERFTTLVCNMVEDIENQEKETNKIIRSVSKEVYLNSDTKNKYLDQS